VERLNAHPDLRERIVGLLRAVENESGELKEADAAELRVIDEMRQMPRYTALMGKAAILDVRIIPLEELGWASLVSAMSELMKH